ncbi:hypothetical protein L1987_52930 [Smallanthus sonchifolius]|uniref:Uncharacterized protein n=1 Tax=Smallanthus sonchifolius TaxID=185202 RepID=A0ACB9EV48_9ASTR|nr:hypothetical protein L1987_52930 [Smallanthus sonchifolius]
MRLDKSEGNGLVTVLNQQGAKIIEMENPTRVPVFVHGVGRKARVMAGGADFGWSAATVTLDGCGCRCSGGRKGHGGRMSGSDERQHAPSEGDGCRAW